MRRIAFAFSMSPETVNFRLMRIIFVDGFYTHLTAGLGVRCAKEPQWLR
ncbi:MAG: hypothetical protein ACJAZ7_000760 [Zhongshania aliphaticivorans]|jgi:hypothetical protein